MKICVTSINYENYTTLSNLTWPNKVAYAISHGYSSFHKKDGFLGGNIVLGFEKIHYIKVLLETTDYDWILFVGCDTLITNFNISIESIIEAHAVDAETCFIVCQDVNGINMDVFLVKNSPEGKQLMNTIWDSHIIFNTRWCYEQQWFWDNANNYSSWIKQISQRVMNSYEYSLYRNHGHIDKTGQDGRWQTGDFLIHWAGIELPKRIELFKKYQQLIIS
jgi:hypothetical protein